MSSLPTPLRAALGVVVTAVDNARTLPQKAAEFPVIAVSGALQLSLRAQQRYAELTVRGDELIGRITGVPDEPPSWATFDESPVDASAVPRDAVATPRPTSARTETASAEALTRTAEAVRPKAAKAPGSPPARRTTPRRAPRPAGDEAPLPVPRNGRPSAFDAVGTDAEPPVARPESSPDT